MSDYYETVCYYITRSIVTLKYSERTMICVHINDVDNDELRMDFNSFFSGHIINSQEFACLVSIDELYYIIAYNYSRSSESINLNIDVMKYSDLSVALNDYNTL